MELLQSGNFGRIFFLQDDAVVNAKNSIILFSVTRVIRNPNESNFERELY